VFTQRRLALKLLLGVLLVWAGTARATECNGLTPISQAIVTAGGGFPFKIVASGSYFLTSDLFVSSSTKDAIDVNVSDVTIDLNGFSIIGPATGTGVGIAAGAQHLITIRSGEVAGMGFDGMQTGHSSQITNMRLLKNGNNGIACADACDISHNVSDNNGLNGIVIGIGGHIASNVVQFNNVGIRVGVGNLPANAVVSDNTANDNPGGGIFVNGGSLVTGNVADNDIVGLQCNHGTSAYSNNTFVSDTQDVSASVGNCVNLGHNLCETTLCP
jgi:hypothetical protein